MNSGKIVKFYIDSMQLEKWLYQNKAEFTGNCIEGVLLDNFGICTPKGFAFIYESYVNANQSRYYIEYAISKRKKDGKFLWCKEFKAVWGNWYTFEKKGENV